MNPNPPQKSYIEGLRDRREKAMRMPALTEQESKDLKLATKLQNDINVLLQRIKAINFMPRRPEWVREEARKNLPTQLQSKQMELKEVMSRIPFHKATHE